MRDIALEVLRRYGLLAVLAGASFALLIWALAHTVAAPGTSVNVLWGLAQYTKAPPESSETVAEPNRRESSASAGTLVGSPPSIAAGAAPPSSTTNSDAPELPEATLSIAHATTAEDANEKLSSLRKDRGLRPITALESGRRIGEAPASTYLHVFAPYLEFSGGEPGPALRGGSAERFPSIPDGSFELHRTEEILIVGFVAESDVVNLGRFDGRSRKTATVFAVFKPQSPYLVSVPMSRILNSDARPVQISSSDSVWVLDLVLM